MNELSLVRNLQAWVFLIQETCILLWDILPRIYFISRTFICIQVTEKLKAYQKSEMLVNASHNKCFPEREENRLSSKKMEGSLIHSWWDARGTATLSFVKASPHHAILMKFPAIQGNVRLYFSKPKWSSDIVFILLYICSQNIIKPRVRTLLPYNRKSLLIWLRLKNNALVLIYCLILLYI